MIPIIIKLKEHHKLPSYVTLRAHIADNIYTAEANESDLERLQNDEAVESFVKSVALRQI